MNVIQAPLQVELNQSGRIYGKPDQNLITRSHQEPPPEIGRIFLEDVEASSAINALPAKPGREQILAAYKHDIDCLARRREEADTFMRAVLETAIIRYGCTEGRQTTEWELLQEILKPLGIDPKIALTAERAALASEELTRWLKDEFKRELDRIARNIATVLQYLADHHVIGLVEFSDIDVCKFHYFTWEIQGEATMTDSDPTMENGWVSFKRTVTDTKKLIRTRNTHHVIGAAIHQVSDYKRPMPNRVKELIARAPEWLKPHLTVIDGTETFSESVTDIAGKVTTTSVSVVRYDPAITFGQFALSGWNDADLKQNESSDESFVSPRTIAIIFVTFMLGISLLAYAIANANAKEDKAYADYVQHTAAAAAVHGTVKKGEELVLPIEFLVKFAGSWRNTGSITLETADRNHPGQLLWERFGGLTQYRDNTCYGDIKLTTVGVPILIHVQKATEDSLTYTAEKVGN